MLLKQIVLHNFRNFNEKTFYFHPFLTIIIGRNAQGKTNLLESIFFLINGVGFRETKEIELLSFLTKQNASVEGVFGAEDRVSRFKIILSPRSDKVVKTFLVNKSKKGFAHYMRELGHAILFTPQHIEILTGSPQGRREYFNKAICLHDLEYKRRLVNYENGLRRRNKILENHTDRIKLKEEISFWNDFLCEQAAYIVKKREEYTLFLNENSNIDKKEFGVEYLKNEFSEKRLKEILEIETKVRRTIIGPQKDDFQMFIGKKDVHRFASRSEQRLTIFWLKLNEITYVEKITKKKPILLFDDIFSELDNKNRKLVLDLIKKYQTVVTTTEAEVLQLVDSSHSLITL